MTQDNITKLTKLLTDQGKIIEAGWASYRHLVIPPTASATQIEETRRGFYAGAVHLFSSIMSILEPGTEPTESDLKRMDHIRAELEEYAQSFRIGVGSKEGGN
jgi:hypothetical protein